MKTLTQYDEKAAQFKRTTGLVIDKRLEGHRPYFDGDKESRDVWAITFKREGRPPYTFSFGQSIAARGEEPSDYDVLACLDSRLCSFEEFCSDFGYDTDSRRALETYLRVRGQSAALHRMFTGDELERLSEIS